MKNISKVYLSLILLSSSFNAFSSASDEWEDGLTETGAYADAYRQFDWNSYERASYFNEKFQWGNSVEDIDIHQFNQINFRNNSFAKPNEREPYLAKNLLSDTNNGIYFTLGTERGFNGASMSNSEYLILADYDPVVNKYNTINMWLLKISSDQKSYLSLRHAKNLSEWQKASESLQDEEKKFFCNQGTFLFWKKHTVGAKYFKKNTYLSNPSQFKKIHSLAVNEKIKVIWNFDLNNLNEVEKLFSKIKNSELYLSVFDISNAWWPIYVKRDKFYQIFLHEVNKLLPPINIKPSIVMYTFNMNGMTSDRVFPWKPIACSFSEDSWSYATMELHRNTAYDTNVSEDYYFEQKYAD